MIKQKLISLIRKIQDYIKIDLFYLIKGEFYLMLGRVITALTAFALALAWANWINPDIYGSYQFILSIAAIISVFSLPELSVAIVQAVARKMEGSLLRGFKTRLRWGVLTGLSSLIIASYYWFQGNISLFLCFLVIAFLLPLFNAFLIYSNFLDGRKLFNIKVKYDSITQVTAACLMILTLYVLKGWAVKYNLSDLIILLTVVAVYYLSRTALRLFFFIRTKNKFKPNKQEDPRTIPYGKHLTFAGFMGTLSEHLDKILLFHYLGAIEVAVYSFALIFPKQIKTFINHIGSLALPKFSVRTREELRESLLRKVYHLAGLITLIVLAYIVVAKWLYQIFFPQYAISVPYSQIYALSVIPLCFAMVSGALKSQMMTKEIYQIKIIAPTIKIILSLILIPLYGIWGAILSVLFSRSINVLIYLWLFRKI